MLVGALSRNGPTPAGWGSCSASTWQRTAPRTGSEDSPPDTLDIARVRCSGKRAGTYLPLPRRQAVCRSWRWKCDMAKHYTDEKNTVDPQTHSVHGSKVVHGGTREDTCASCMAPADSRVLHWKSAQGTGQPLSSRRWPAANSCVLQYSGSLGSSSSCRNYPRGNDLKKNQ